MSSPIVVIPAAGESRRYKEAGYALPKPLLKVRDSSGATRSMLQHVALSHPCFRVIAGLPAGCDIPDDYIGEVMFIRETRGQADTVFQLTRTLPFDARVLVLDCDMRLPSWQLDEIVKSLEYFDVSVAVTSTFDPNASRVDVIPFPLHFVEKEPISEWGIVGARAFRRAGQLTDALEEYMRKTDTEPYLSSAINLIAGSKYAHVIQLFEDWGTPERLAASGAQIVD